MLHQPRKLSSKFIRRYLLAGLFAVSLLISLGWEQIVVHPFAAVAIAQAPLPDEWMQQGASRYRSGDVAGAIADWRTALALYQADRNLAKAAIVLENLARAHQALGQTSEELRYWQQASAIYREIGNPMRLARLLTEQAQAYSRTGQYRQAIALLCGPEDFSDAAADRLINPSVNPSICEQTSALGLIEALPDRDPVGQAAALGSLGDAYRMRGRADRAIFYLEQGLAIARGIQEPLYLISTLNSLGNAHLSRAQFNYRLALSARQIKEERELAAFESAAQLDDAKALAYLQESLAIAQTTGDRPAQLRSLISSLPVYYRSGETAAGNLALQQAISLVEAIPNSPDKVYAAIDLARWVQAAGWSPVASGRQCLAQAVAPQAAALLNQAIASAQQTGDRRSESFALGELGHLYECQPDYARAIDLTRQAQLAADQGLEARDSLYLWQWQLGRIFKAQGEPTEAIRAYEASLATLEALRQDILTASRDVQFDFREAIEPIYRELVALRLQQEQPSVLIQVANPGERRDQDNISLALNTLDNLKLAELQNYFGNDCVLTALNAADPNIARRAPQTAVFSTVLLGDRTAVILSLPTQSPAGEPQMLQQFEWIQDSRGNYLSQDVLTATVNRYREGLERVRDALPGAPLAGYDPTLAQQLYDWLIRPFEALLQQQQIQTLVFVQDGIFRSVPMAALYDGQQFLVERYAIAMTPSLNLTNLAKPDRQRLRALAVGLTESATVNGTSFPALRYVSSELQAIQAILPRSLELRDQDFTRDRFQQALQTGDYPIVHMATHGQFSPEAENAFLVTGSTPTQPDQRLTLTVLDDMIRQTSAGSPLELLVLSACQTARGDDRAALGLAGIAAQAGAKRVLASLWSVNDQATTGLITQFYRGVANPEFTQAQALQAAQMALISSGQRTAHPGFWAAFILIGNWL